MKKMRKSYLYLFAAAVTQLASIIVLITSLLTKKKHPLSTVLSILALEGGTTLLLLAHTRKELKSIDMMADDEDEIEIELSVDEESSAEQAAEEVAE